MARAGNGEVRLSDVAARCGVSVVTAAKVLNNSGGSNTRVGAATAARVLEVAKEMAYRPNLSARNLRVGSSRLIGVLIDSANIGGLARLLAGIERRADELGYRVMIAEEHDKVSSVIAGYQSFRQYGAEGVVCVSHDYLGGGEELYRFFARQPRLAFIGRPRLEPAVYVDVDNAARPALALDFLWRSGRRRIAQFIDDAPYVALEEQRHGFGRRLTELGGEYGRDGRTFTFPLPLCDTAALRDEIDRRLDREILPWGADAIIAMTDTLAGYVLRALRRRGVRMPDDIAIVGNGNDLFCEILDPALASVDTGLSRQGAAAVDLIAAMAESGDAGGVVSPPRIEPEFVWRQSAGGRPPIASPETAAAAASMEKEMVP